MNRKRDGLVPVGEAFSGPSVQAIRAASPQARHHFTRFDQVDQLVAASEADPDRSFMARLLALCSLPRTNPGTRFLPTSPAQSTGFRRPTTRALLTKFRFGCA